MDTTNVKLIGITGLMWAGKSAVADTLREYRQFRCMKFADTLKDMLRACGLTQQEIEGDLKERPCGLLGGITPRYAMQTLGTEWGRNFICDDLWVRIAMAKYHQVAQDHPWASFVFDDVRFPNEAEAILEWGGEVWRVVRPSLDHPHSDHESEVLQAKIPVSLTIMNHGSLDDLVKTVLLIP